MQIRLKVVLLAVIPLLLAFAAMSGVVVVESRRLAQAESDAIEPILIDKHKAELRGFVDLALGAIRPLHAAADQDAARREALAILSHLDYGEDGYFFVYDLGGRNLMHPRQPELVGRDLSGLRDPLGRPTIRQLLDAARAGGGFVEFMWERPSTHRLERKLGYVTIEPTWGWMIGTGVYLDVFEQTRSRLDHEAAKAVDSTLRDIAVISAVATLLVALGGLALNLSDQRRAEARMRELARQVVSSQEAERARVARELHDGVSQSLVSAKFVFETALAHLEAAGAAAPAPSLQALQHGLERLHGVLQEIRRISHGLRPALLDQFGLPSALGQILADFATRTGIAVEARIDPALELPEAVGTGLFRVAQEALNNVERHAGARSVTVSLQGGRKGLQLTVADDGHGFDASDAAAAARPEFGLASMRERVETLGGRFSIRSSPLGTVVAADLPAAAVAL